MSNRSYSYDKGSSRSARDDSRRTTERDERHRHGEGSSRDPGKQRPRSPRDSKTPEHRHSQRSPDRRMNSNDRERSRIRSRSPFEREPSDDEVPAPPPPPRITKISIGFSKPKVAPIKMNIGGAAKASTVVPKPTVASVFNADDDEDEPEEMPAEARMRMRNIGRETPTSAGPNSFGKTKQGFCDAKKLFEKNLKQSMEAERRPPVPKFPQTIYKIKGP